MSVLTEYFAAASDEQAADVLAWPAGPGGGAAHESAPARLLRRPGRRSGRGPSGLVDPVVDGGGIEPMLQMLVLESVLTGRSEEDIEDDRSGEEMIAGSEADGPSIVRLSDELATALRGAGSSDLAAAAETWAETEEFNGSSDAETLATFLGRLADLARAAADVDASLYCWVSP